jgi:two-component system, NarL family, sensor histidine kinase DevS
MGYLVSGGPPVGVHLALDRVPEIARDTTGARYAALAVINEQRTGLEHFLTAGVDEDTRLAIGHPPGGRGVLGELIVRPRPLRLADLRDHVSSYGFPAGHPVMRSFLGVPIMIRGRAWGSLHLAEKAEGEFTEEDEEATVALAEQAANTISFERRFQGKAAVD